MEQVKNVDWKDKRYVRAGIIPFTVIGDFVFYAFGLDDSVTSISDLGGHIEKTDTDALDAAIREYDEECFSIFGKLNREMLSEFYTIKGKKTIEILLPVEPPLFKYTHYFRELLGDNPNHEVQQIIWISREQLLLALENQQLKINGTKIFHMNSVLLQTFIDNKDFL